MGAQRTSFDKLQRERAKKAKAAAKRERRLEKDSSPAGEVERPVPTEGELSAPQLLELVERIHRQFEAKQIDYEEFEEKKADLLARLPIN